KDSRWIYFESGAGFARSCTIPLAVGNITVDTLDAPMKLLQARNLDATGLQSLTNDLAKMAGIRQPSRYPGMDEALKTIDEFLKIRQAPPINATGNPAIKLAEDTEILHRVDAIRVKARELVIRSVLSRSAPFDIPGIVEMKNMKFSELFEIADAIGLEVPFLSRLILDYYVVPPSDTPEWKKINERNELEGLEKEWAEFEARMVSVKR
ncbi:MAG: hypothetical protein WC889_09555, partial [Myxococcota bacterium]